MKKLLILFLSLLLCPVSASADVVVFKNGKRIETKEAWEENGQIKCHPYGGVVAYPKGQVERIERGRVEEEKSLLPRNETRQFTPAGSSGSAKQGIISRTRELYLELIEFKDDPKFRQVGFAPNYKYNKWKRKVEILRKSPDSKLLLKEGVVVGDLLMLGLEYLGNGGRETYYTRFINKQFRRALNLK